MTRQEAIEEIVALYQVCEGEFDFADGGAREVLQALGCTEQELRHLDALPCARCTAAEHPSGAAQEQP